MSTPVTLNGNEIRLPYYGMTFYAVRMNSVSGGTCSEADKISDPPEAVLDVAVPNTPANEDAPQLLTIQFDLGVNTTLSASFPTDFPVEVAAAINITASRVLLVTKDLMPDAVTGQLQLSFIITPATAQTPGEWAAVDAAAIFQNQYWSVTVSPASCERM